MTATSGLSRRDFLKASAAAGAGLTLAVHTSGCAPGTRVSTDAPLAPDAWIRIRPDGTVTVEISQSEMGQGVKTSLPMLVAEELDADWSKVRFEQSAAAKVYANPMMFGAQGTGGSSSIRANWQPLREAGARARAMLLSAAASRFGVDVASCRAEKGVVYHDASGRSASYGELAAAAGALPVPEKVTLKDPKDFRIIGKPLPRLDSPAIVRGEPVFAIDASAPGMLVGVVARCPVFGGKVRSVDATAAKAVPGVQHVVQISSGVAVVAKGYWAATRGRAALRIEWDEGPRAAVDDASISAEFRRLAAEPGAPVVRKDGNVDAALASASKTIEAVYELPYLAHATMEPMSCAADVRADSCTLWAPTQMPWAPWMFGGGAKGLAARIAGVSEDRVTVHVTQLGGGFGRRAEMDFITEAVETSKAAGAPVKLLWSREDDIQHDFYRPATYHSLRGGIDAAGSASAWKYRIVAPSIITRFLPGWIPERIFAWIGMLPHGVDPSSVEGAENTPYAVPNLEVSCARADVGIPVGFWRSVGNTHTGFVCESFIDELAHLAGKDPLDFRRALLKGAPRHLAALELAAERAGWGTPLPEGRARGIAVHFSFGSYVAEVAEVSLDADGTPRVHRVVCAVDCGMVVNPDTVVAQMESGIVYGLSAALSGEINILKGRVTQTNFSDYPVLRMDRSPAIEVHIVPSREAPGGVGEPSTPPIAPAVTNALFALTGQRIRKLPIRTLQQVGSA